MKLLFPLGLFLAARSCQDHGGGSPNSTSAGKYSIVAGDSTYYMIKDSAGVLRETYMLLRGKPEGPWSYMHANGRLQQLITFHHGLRNGWLTEYDTAGQIEKRVHYERDSPLGHAFFYTNGTVDVYNAFDHNGGSICVVEYDDAGKLESFDGRCISTEYSVIDSFICVVYATPPGITTTLEASNGLSLDTLNGIVRIAQSDVTGSDSIAILCSWRQDGEILQQANFTYR